MEQRALNSSNQSDIEGSTEKVKEIKIPKKKMKETEKLSKISKAFGYYIKMTSLGVCLTL